jgi:hypothetical protein
VRRDELAIAVGDQVIETYGKARLLTFDRDRPRAADGGDRRALIRRWDRLRAWIDDSREELRVHRRLTAAAREWIEARKDLGFLASGARLTQFEHWSKTTGLTLSRQEYDYLAASLSERDRQVAAERQRQAREQALERRSVRTLRALVAVLLVGAVAASILAVVALNQSQEAQRASANAENARATSEANAVIAANNAQETHNFALIFAAQQALSDYDTPLALALSLEVNRVEQPLARAQQVLARAAYSPGARRRLLGHTDIVHSVVFMPDGKTALSGSQDKTNPMD